MSNGSGWSIVFYVEDSGRDPVREFILSLDDKTSARIFASIERLKLENTRARMPLVRQVEGKIWELRQESHTNIYRILYFFFVGRKIVLLHGFQKKTQKTPRREFEIAARRLVHFVMREGGEV